MQRLAESYAPQGRLEDQLGYAFNDPTLLRRALTHRSFGADNFERLEFLGDATLGFVVGRLLYDAMPTASEHRLTLMRANLVRKESLAALARTLDLGVFLRLGTGERKAGVATRASILADALEAVVGAILCDGGVECAEAVVRRLFADRFAETGAPTDIGEDDLKDPKTRLQEYLQSRGLKPPTYEIVDNTGPDHARRFTARCRTDGLAGPVGEGTGRSRREAEKGAAAAVLEQLKP